MKEITLEDWINASPIPATQEIPDEMREMLSRSTGVYVRSKSKPKMDFATENVSGAPEMWRVVDGLKHEELLTTIPGQEQIELNAGGMSEEKDEASGTESHRPLWLSLEYLPRLVPFRAGGRIYLEPRAIEEGNRLIYPWCTIGMVLSSNGSQGSGVLVGPNLMLTAGHLVPWGMNPWSIEFVPAFRAGDTRPPFGNSFVETYRGYNTNPETSGYDYVVCKLYTPLGQALGWLGTQSWGNEDEYYRRRYVSSGYPGTFGGRPAVELDMGLRDIDNDSPGKELEFSYAGHPDLKPGWSGGPLWLPNEKKVYGVLSGWEFDGYDPRFHVFAGGKGMVDLVKFGLENWCP
ncbi:MAG: V8-like Glu-specific endopeptidase [Eubacterium sp.]|jgi:hypothetical protein|nr:V8-like Glu-specific endopeptidase [Eubacterium sp.]